MKYLSQNGVNNNKRGQNHQRYFQNKNMCVLINFMHQKQLLWHYVSWKHTKQTLSIETTHIWFNKSPISKLTRTLRNSQMGTSDEMAAVIWITPVRIRVTMDREGTMRIVQIRSVGCDVDMFYSRTEFLRLHVHVSNYSP